MSLTIKVPISDNLVPVLEQKARIAGLKREEYVNAIVSRDLNSPPTLDRVLAAFRTEVSASGVTDLELDDFLRTARDEVGAQENV